MKRSFLDILACPDCRFPLEVSVFEEDRFKQVEIIEGLLQCKKCGKVFPIIESIPRFVPNILGFYPSFVEKYPEIRRSMGPAEKEFLSLHGRTQERFGMEWMRYPGSMPEDRTVFLDETQIPEEEWKGKKVLDGGCGMGRYSRVAHELGAAVVAMDLSGALVRLWDLAKESDRMHLVQGNLMSPPFREHTFDVVYSVGVIHHTPSARTTFSRLSRLVRPGGRLTLWVYGTAGKFRDFRTNPLRPGRQGLRKYMPLVWAVVLVRETLSDFLRLFTVHVPHRLLYLLCYPLALLGAVPLVKYLTFSVHPLWRVRLQENFDWLSPPYQSHHSKEELMGWFEEEGFEVQKVLPHGVVPKPGVLGRKK